MKKNMILLSLITVPLLVGCGGGSSTTGIVANNDVAKISGTVPGTLIEAYCDDGTYVQVTSTQNGTDQHPFELSIPQNTKCKVVMTTNENDPINRVITPIGYVQGTATGTTLSLTGDIDLGNVPLALSPSDINDTNNDQVSDTSLDVVLDTSNATLSNTSVQDTDNDGTVDAYNDDDNDGVVNAYEDDDNDGKENIYDDDDQDKTPDYLEDDDNDGKINHRDDDDQNNQPDYTEDDDNDGKANHIDDKDGNGSPDYAEDDDNDGKDNHIDSDDDGNGIDDEQEQNEQNEQNEGTDLN